MSTPPDMGRQTFRAALWVLVSSTGKRLLTLLGLMLLARVLAPHDFGLLGFAMIYLSFVEVIGDIGAGAALVYWPNRREDAAQASFVVNVIMGTFWCCTTLLVAPLVADYFNAPNGTLILQALAVSSLIKALGNTHDALAQKDLKFKERSIPEMAVTGVKSAVALLLAWFGFGVWSLVWGHLAGLVAWTVLLWVVVPWRPSFHIPRDLFAPMLRYGRHIVAVQMLSALMFHIDVVVLGRFLGITALGLYQMAARIPDSTVMVLIWVAAKALFPTFSKMHAEGADVKGALLVAARCVSSVTLPAAFGLFWLAGPIMLVFFGEQWASAAPIMAILALYVGTRGFDEFGNVLKSTGRTKTLVWLAVLKAVMLVPAVIYGATISATAVAAALAIVSGIGAAIAIIIAARIIGVSLPSIALAYSRSSTAVAVMSGALWMWMRWSTG
jgi:O-antigen/teichoic acid export membrane protein